MPDDKTCYSDSAHKYIDNNVQYVQIDKIRYERAKEREKEFGTNWDNNKVDINEIINKFTPDVSPKIEGGIKIVYRNDLYTIKCDLVGGYLEIYDKNGNHIMPDGSINNDNNTNHFRIKTREEMDYDNKKS